MCASTTFLINDANQLPIVTTIEGEKVLSVYMGLSLIGIVTCGLLKNEEVFFLVKNREICTKIMGVQTVISLISIALLWSDALPSSLFSFVNRLFWVSHCLLLIPIIIDVILFNFKRYRFLIIQDFKCSTIIKNEYLYTLQAKYQLFLLLGLHSMPMFILLTG
jgi:hypothetical protein